MFLERLHIFASNKVLRGLAIIFSVVVATTVSFAQVAEPTPPDDPEAPLRVKTDLVTLTLTDRYVRPVCIGPDQKRVYDKR